MRDNAAGRKAQRVGRQFESFVDDQHERARELGIVADVEHNQAHVEVIGGRPQYIEPGKADYTGILEGGRYFATEAKSTLSSRFGRNEVTTKQQAHLERVALAGGLSLLLVEFRTTAVFHRYAIPWLEVPWVIMKTAESVVQKDIVKWLVVEGDCYLARWHPGGARSCLVSTNPRVSGRRYARE